MIKVGIIILNYLAYQETIQFIDSIRKQDQTNVFLKIIIVDNGSFNESVSVLQAEYQGDAQIQVVAASKNLGFANGNNLGYETLLKDMTPDYVIAANDDIILEQDGLFEWIMQKDKQYQFGVLGPSVFSVKQKGYQSPMENHSVDIQECKGKIKKAQHNLYVTLIKLYIKKILRLPDYKHILHVEKEKCESATDNKTLHGSFLVFSKKYMECYTHLFDEQTYLYMEENILKLRCDFATLPMIYCPDYQVQHLQSVSMIMVHKTRLELNYFKQKHYLNSLKRYVQILQETAAKNNQNIEK